MIEVRTCIRSDLSLIYIPAPHRRRPKLPCESLRVGAPILGQVLLTLSEK